MKAKIKILKRVVNEHAWVNDTWLAPYFEYPATLFVYASGKKHLLVDGNLYKNVEGTHEATGNGWRYKIEKLLSPIL